MQFRGVCIILLVVGSLFLERHAAIEQLQHGDIVYNRDQLMALRPAIAELTHQIPEELRRKFRGKRGSPTICPLQYDGTTSPPLVTSTVAFTADQGKKLTAMQVDAPLVSWIVDYLTGRPQYVRLQHCVSDRVSVALTRNIQRSNDDLKQMVSPCAAHRDE
ncbi:hypothetical protein SKAU_G00024450 [Synaphobranchus kaupii]|uniref:Uncharacterized protein n=1 Tax=Synaphobranchus kaupii TaxID=118154 RepID=A0A9Q1GD04_SYNKA|nr:hypothetical protein SKAU_G00024450 [Synaphobranchus kaupii]